MPAPPLDKDNANDRALWNSEFCHVYVHGSKKHFAFNDALTKERPTKIWLYRCDLQSLQLPAKRSDEFFKSWCIFSILMMAKLWLCKEDLLQVRHSKQASMQKNCRTQKRKQGYWHRSCWDNSIKCQQPLFWALSVEFLDDLHNCQVTTGRVTQDQTLRNGSLSWWEESSGFSLSQVRSGVWFWWGIICTAASILVFTSMSIHGCSSHACCAMGPVDHASLAAPGIGIYFELNVEQQNRWQHLVSQTWWSDCLLHWCWCSCHKLLQLMTQIVVR